MSRLGISDLSVRDGNQSLLATRMSQEDMVQLAEKLDKVGFDSMEVWGGATFDTSFRYLDVSAWDNLRAIRKVCKNTKLSMLLRGQNVVGYHHYDNDTLDRFVRLMIENGIDIVRVFDALNDPNNVENSFKSVKKHGGHLQAAIAYTTSPVHNNEYYVDLVKTYESMGADSICIKDMAGIITAEDAYALVKAIKGVTELPVTLHSHTTANMTHIVFEQAMKAGVDVVDGCISPLSGGTSHLADETIVAIAEGLGLEVSVDKDALTEAYNFANELVNKYIDSGDYRTRSLIPNPMILEYQVPGGMLSNLYSQLEDMSAGDRLSEVLEEIPHVRKDLGYPPLVTPMSQMVGTQAVFNVLMGERYKMSPKEIKDYVKGFYGQAPGKLDETIKEKVLSKDKERDKKPTPIAEVPYEYEKNRDHLKETFGEDFSEEDVVAYTIFPPVVEEYFKRQKGMAGVEEKPASQEKAPQETTPAPAPSAGATTITAPIPGTIISVNVKEGDAVTKGQVLIILDSMKLENEIVSTVDGTVTGIHTAYDRIVNAGDPLISIG